MLDDEGYVGRHLLWDIPVPTPDETALLAAPIVVAMQAELGADRVVGVEIWHLRSRAEFFVTAVDALTRLGEVERIVAQYVG